MCLAVVTQLSLRSRHETQPDVGNFCSPQKGRAMVDKKRAKVEQCHNDYPIATNALYFMQEATS